MLARIKKAVQNPRLAIRRVRWLIKRAREWLFDYITGVETRTTVDHEKLDSVDGLYLHNARTYQPCRLSNLKMSIKYIVKTYNGSCHFVDVGCGKGRACFFAARYFPKITGIDFSPTLIETAKTNLRNFTGDRQKIEFLVRNAASFHLPDERCVLFLYNPFDEVVLGKFLRLNYRHFSRYHSIIIYVNDVCSELLLSAGFLRSYKFKHRAVSIYTVGPHLIS